MSDADTADRITCKYLTYRHGSGFIRLPLVHVSLKAKDEIQTDALVDSDATATFVPYEIAEMIGLLPEGERGELKKGQATGASAAFPTYLIKLSILKVIKAAHPFDILRDIDVHVPQSEHVHLPYVVLGRNYLFKHFDVTFHENRHKMTFQRIKGA